MTEKRVSVFVCGVQKGGTTSLFDHFCEHPDLSAPRRKELHFFDNEKFKWPTPSYKKQFDRFFRSDDGDRLRFDITPNYTFWPPAIQRIHAYNPAAKLIYLFRDPFERAWSQWCMVYARGEETLPFSEAIRDGRKRLDALTSLTGEYRLHTYAERSLYGEQVARALEHFPREQMLFLRSEEFSKDHATTLDRIAKFLNIAAFPSSEPKRKNSRPKSVITLTPTDEDREFFLDFVRDDMINFSKLTGLELTPWPTVRNLQQSAEAVD